MRSIVSLDAAALGASSVVRAPRPGAALLALQRNAQGAKPGSNQGAGRGLNVRAKASSKVRALKMKEAETEAATEEQLPSPESGKKSKSEKKLKKRKIKFSKYHGLGNDFILIDNRKQAEPLLSEAEAVKLCDRNFGIGGDGVIFLLPSQQDSEAQYSMRIFNSDGSEPEMCGNGIRCLARFLADVDEVMGPQRYVVSTLAGNMVLDLRSDGQVCVDMGEPRLRSAEIPTTLAPTTTECGGAVVAAPLDVAGATWRVTCVSMGNPHCITFASSQQPQGLDVDALPLSTIGPLFEHHPAFPARINTEFVQVISPRELKMRVWERGAGATLACGTGACALVVAAVLEGRAERSCLVHLPGGPLEIDWRAEDNRIYMTGPAEIVFTGKFSLPANS